MGKEAGKRYNITIPLGVAEKLEKWARVEASGSRSNASGLAARLVIEAVYDAEERGLLSKGELTFCKSLSHLIYRYWGQFIEYGRIPLDRLQDLKDGQPPTELEIARIAICLSVPEGEVEDVVNKGQSEVKNGS